MLMTGVSCAAQATVLFESPAYPDVALTPAGYWCSTCAGLADSKVYGQFTLGSASAISAISFAIEASYGGPNWDILVQVWNSDRSTTLFSNTLNAGSYTLTTKLASGSGTDLVSASLGSLDLGAGDYWMSWHSSPQLAIPLYISIGSQSYQSGNNVTLTHYDPAFALLGRPSQSIPEPDTLALLGIGVAGFAFGHRYKARTVLTL